MSEPEMVEGPPIPIGWQWAPLRDLTAIEPNSLTDGPFGSKLKSSHYTTSGVRVVRLGNLGVGEFKNTDKSHISLGHYDSLKKHEVFSGDLLIAALAEPVGRCCEAPAELGKAIVKADCVRFKPHPELVPRALMYWLNSPEGKNNAEHYSHGMGRLRMNMGNMRELPLPIPPFNEQRRIVANIETLQTHSDAAKQALDAVGPLLERFRQSVLAAAFRGDLTAAWREQNPDVEPASALLERIRVERKARFIETAGDKARTKAEAKARADGKAWTEVEAAKVVEKARAKAEAKYVEPEPVDATGLPELPQGWCWARLEELASDGPTNGYSGRTSGNATGTLTLKLSATTKGFIYIRDSTTKRLIESIPESSSHWLKVGDILVQRANSLQYLGATAIFMGADGPMIYPDLMMRIRTGRSAIAQFIWRFLNGLECRSYFRSKATGTAGGMPKINGKTLRSVRLPLPPEPEIEQLLNAISMSFSAGKALECEVEDSGEHLSQLNKSILAKAFRGELVPQDPNDEPASVLLERIRAERAAAPAKKRKKKPPRARKPKQAAPPPPPKPPPAPPPPASPSAAPKQLSLLVHSPPERVAPEDEPLEVMALLRSLLRNRGATPREDTLRALAEGLGCQRLSAKLRERLDGHLRVAVRRQVLEAGGGEDLRLATRKLEDYSRDELVAGLRSVSRKGCVYEREELARALLDHLGFRRMTQGASKAIKSAFNAAIRREHFERAEGTRVRRL